MEFSEIFNWLTKGGGLVAIGLGIKYVVEQINAHIKRRDERKNKDAMILEKIKKVFNDTRDMYAVMNEITRNTPYKRVSILRLNNGGMDITPLSKMYLSVLHESYDSPLNSVKEDYNDLLIDYDYLQILVKCFNSKKHQFKTQNLNPSMIKSQYIEEGVMAGKILFLTKNSKSQYFFLSAVSPTDLDELTQKEKNYFNKKVQRIKSKLDIEN